MNTREIQSSESQARVLHAAYELFLQNGLTAVSMQQIADSVGITKATLYHHFRDKQHLYLATMQLAIVNNERALKESMAKSNDLPHLVRQLLGFLFGDARSDLQRLATDFRLHFDKAAQKEFWDQYERPWRLLEREIHRISGCDSETASHLSRYFYGAASGLSQLYRYESEDHAISEVVIDRLAETLLCGISSCLEHPK